MSDNSLLSLIANLNAESPVMSSPEDFSADLSLWTNAEFTFDIPPGLGIFENDSGFEALSSMNHPAHVLAPETTSPPARGPEPKHLVGHNPQSVLDQQHLMEYLNLPNEESRPSLLERTRQRNPVKAEVAPTPSPQLQEQAAAINAFHSLLAAYSATQVQQQQQLQQPQLVQVQNQTYQRLATQSSPSLPLLRPNIAPATAPTTPAAAKLLRQNVSQYKPATIAAKKAKAPAKAPRAISPSPSPPTTPILAPAPIVAPKSPATVNASAIAAAAIASSKASKAKAAPVSEDKEMEDVSEELSPADSFSKDDPDYLTKVAAEEDKRRRNTAASARFRYKKKLREQALEQTAKEQTQRAEALEARVKELEMEVKWLRGLIVEKDSRLHEVSAGTEEQATKRIKLDVY
ncbi:hypothetical protein CPC16_006145 [Podila verticillata]|nr:hypothetical protein BGZ52_003961 [Haplosporangium bisporale]KAF9217506.1 hypothetical protein BGZ59_003518 [Podila verticillata]KAF9388942.1 hypothetical protein CPC16_006145 [Podila verticillata]KFH71947.1 hypothetical protein MVEG_02241 [Podila verticillata NRRL 6337]